MSAKISVLALVDNAVIPVMPKANVAVNNVLYMRLTPH
ncbi:hypothetical protein CWATWH0402_643 [Crocosphaera watsonii WH 0402]|uniref:Uncharacterized protein n=4 Tax=Crocosphaera watsonii TaxID=263511 RepID=T2JKU8_CROWT|nr:hypothetical protein CWATWH0003_1861 [Crocosphaera watsonii WH 0003]CCQ55128.1 hypothetical protein CWATWH0005_780 [Crocosphaera watsonii WH 0005]CCQ61334.1 hypothetical protein CWATWH0401_1550 [Crocosphaera watsonii WH 0401]CCQ66463.1 hypothetical protein CWATWH0402_643 [Crocosphaera watsonii WH 0402]